jgi:hypothetical protein
MWVELALFGDVRLGKLSFFLRVAVRPAKA